MADDFQTRVRRRLANITRELADEFSKHRDKEVQGAVVRLHEIARSLEDAERAADQELKTTDELPAYRDPPAGVDPDDRGQ